MIRVGTGSRRSGERGTVVSSGTLLHPPLQPAHRTVVERQRKGPALLARRQDRCAAINRRLPGLEDVVFDSEGGGGRDKEGRTQEVAEEHVGKEGERRRRGVGVGDRANAVSRRQAFVKRGRKDGEGRELRPSKRSREGHGAAGNAEDVKRRRRESASVVR